MAPEVYIYLNTPPSLVLNVYWAYDDDLWRSKWKLGHDQGQAYAQHPWFAPKHFEGGANSL